MAKLTLSIDEQLIREAKLDAVNLDTTVSSLVEEGLRFRRDLQRIAALMLRAWHHFQDATPFVVPAVLAFREKGFTVALQLTGFQLTKSNRRYILEHKKEEGQMIIRIHPYGRRLEVVDTVNVTSLADRIRRSKGTADYAAVIKEVWKTAEALREHADASAE